MVTCFDADCAAFLTFFTDCAACLIFSFTAPLTARLDLRPLDLRPLDLRLNVFDTAIIYLQNKIIF
jgi:hypothetical protein